MGSTDCNFLAFAVTEETFTDFFFHYELAESTPAALADIWFTCCGSYRR